MSSSRPTTKPGVVVSTTNAVGPRSVLASTVQTSAIGPLVMKIFVPFRTKSSPSRTAVVRIAAASLPASGSVDAQAPISEPSHRPGSQRCCSCGVPCSQIGTLPITQCAPSDRPNPPSSPPSASASFTRQQSRIEPPEPPCSSGIGMPATPAAASCFQTSGSQRPSRSRSAAPGAITSAASRFIEA